MNHATVEGEKERQDYIRRLVSKRCLLYFSKKDKILPL